MPKAAPISTSTRRLTLATAASAFAALLPEPARSAVMADAGLLAVAEQFASLEARLEALLDGSFEDVRARDAELRAVSDQQTILAERAMLMPCRSMAGLRAKAAIADAYRSADDDRGDCLADRVRSAVVRDLLDWPA